MHTHTHESMCKPTYNHTHTHTYMHTHTHIYLHTYMVLCIYAYKYVNIHIHTYVCTRRHSHTFTQKHTLTQTHIQHTHTHTQDTNTLHPPHSPFKTLSIPHPSWRCSAAACEPAPSCGRPVAVTVRTAAPCSPCGDPELLSAGHVLHGPPARSPSTAEAAEG